MGQIQQENVKYILPLREAGLKINDGENRGNLINKSSEINFRQGRHFVFSRTDIVLHEKYLSIDAELPPDLKKTKSRKKYKTEVEKLQDQLSRNFRIKRSKSQYRSSAKRVWKQI